MIVENPDKFKNEVQNSLRRHANAVNSLVDNIEFLEVKLSN